MKRESYVAVVDDDASVRKAICRLMRSNGLASRDFGSVEEFLAMGAPAPACLVVDVHAPGSTDVAVTDVLRRRGIPSPVVFITARAEEIPHRLTLTAGAAALLAKPFLADSLLGAVREAMTRAADVLPNLPLG